jgi:hypothetical protein
VSPERRRTLRKRTEKIKTAKRGFVSLVYGSTCQARSRQLSSRRSGEKIRKVQKKARDAHVGDSDGRLVLTCDRS